MNRSMSAHVLLEEVGYRLLTSYGTSDMVRLPHRRGPIAFQWAGPGYAAMEEEMSRTYPDHVWMQVSGIAGMLQRNARLKHGPESWYAQDEDAIRRHDVVIVFDPQAYEQVVYDMEARLRERDQTQQAAADVLLIEGSQAEGTEGEGVKADAAPASATDASAAAEGARAALTVDTAAPVAVATTEAGATKTDDAPPAGTPSGPARTRARCEAAEATAAPSAARPVAVLLLPTRDNLRDAATAAGHCLAFVDAMDEALRRVHGVESASDSEEVEGLGGLGSPGPRPSKYRRVTTEEEGGEGSRRVAATPSPSARSTNAAGATPGAASPTAEAPRLRPRTAAELQSCLNAGLDALVLRLGEAALAGASFRIFDF